MQRAPTSCSPPRGVAANCAAQRAAKARTNARPPAQLNSPPKFQPKARPDAARLENRSRFSSPKNRHVPKLAPTLGPVSASLRLRLRSATFPSPAGISSRFCSPQNERNPSLGGRATGFSRADRVFSHVVLCSRAGGNLNQTQIIRLNDFLLQQSRAVELCPV